MTAFIRFCLAVLFLDEVIVGGWNATAPENFYWNFPTVDLTPPFSEHYARDFGGATLGIALVLLIAVVRPKTHFVVPAAAAFCIFAIPHFFFHVVHLDGTTSGEAIALTAANGMVALLGIAATLTSVARDRKLRTTVTLGPVGFKESDAEGSALGGGGRFRRS